MASTAIKPSTHQTQGHLSIIGPHGLVPCCKVRVTLQRHAFHFGCNAFGWNKTHLLRHNKAQSGASAGDQLESDVMRIRRRIRKHAEEYDLRTQGDDHAYTQRFLELFNFAVVPFYENAVQPDPDTFRLHRAGQIAAWARQYHLTVKGHPLLFHHEKWLPDWMMQLDEHGYWDAMDRRFASLIGHFDHELAYWDFINEPMTHPSPAPSASEAVCRAYQLARRYSDCRGLTLNFSQTEAASDLWQQRTLAMIRETLDRGVRPDILGIQAHLGRLTEQSWDRFCSTIQAFQSFGIPIHITESTLSSGNDLPPKESEEKQAQDLETFYTFLFDQPMVKAVVWWDLTDRHSFCLVGGLLRQDLSPKPAFESLSRLIHDVWHTDESLEIVDGHATFTGFEGLYHAWIQLPDGLSLLRSFDLKDGDNHVIELDIRPPQKQK
jgi:GH35 family endo-1,4-beta-xylanase